MTGFIETIILKSTYQIGATSISPLKDKRKVRKELRSVIEEALLLAAQETDLTFDTNPDRIVKLVMRSGASFPRRPSSFISRNSGQTVQLDDINFGKSLKNMMPPGLITDLANLGVDPDQLFGNFGLRFPEVVHSRSLDSSSSLTAIQDRIDAQRQLDVTSSVADHLGVDVSSVSEILERLMDDSKQRIVRRLRAISVPDTLMDIIQDSLNLIPFPNIGDSGFYLLQADAGSGKSTIAERIHQGVIEAAMDDSLAPLPLFLEARKIRDTIEVDLREAWGSNSARKKQQISLVIDGLEEVGTIRARELLLEAHALYGSASSPLVRVIATSRPINVEVDSGVHIPVTLLDASMAATLVNQLSGQTHAAVRLAQVVRNSITKPFFAIAAGLALRQDSSAEIPTQSKVIESVARRAILDDDWQEYSEILLEIASQCLDARHALIRIRDTRATLKDRKFLEESRLLEVSGNSVGFQNAIVAEWFAAEFLGQHPEFIDELLSDPVRLDLWRYPLLMVIESKSLSLTEGILVKLATHAPAMTGWILGQPDPFDPRMFGGKLPELTSPLNEADVAHQFRLAFDSLVAGTAPVSARIGYTQSGVLKPLGFSLDERSCIYAWHRIREDNLDILSDPPHPLSGHNQEWIGSTWTQVTDHPAWVWREAFRDVRGRLKNVLKDGTVFNGSSVNRAEYTWHLIGDVINRSGRRIHVPIELSELEQVLADRDSTLARLNITARDDHPTAVIRETINALRSEGVSELIPPWPNPDLSTPQTPWVWGLWSREGLLRRVESVFQAALEMVEAALSDEIPEFTPELRLNLPWPMKVFGLIHWPSGDTFADQPSFMWRCEPVVGKSSVEWRFASSREELYEEFGRSSQGVISHLGEPTGIYSIKPATALAVSLLWKALDHWSWTVGAPPTP